MTDRSNDPLDLLARIAVPSPREHARRDAFEAAMSEFGADNEITLPGQGTSRTGRLISGVLQTWRRSMTTRAIAGPALATMFLVPVAGFIAYQSLDRAGDPTALDDVAPAPPVAEGGKTEVFSPLAPRPVETERFEAAPEGISAAQQPALDAMMPEQQAMIASETQRKVTRGVQLSLEHLRSGAPVPAPSAVRSFASPVDSTSAPMPAPHFAESGDRVQEFTSNPIKRVAEEPVSTFSIDVDTASYSHVRRSLKAGLLPDPETVRVEELVNYFPYAWPAPQTREEGFRPTVTVMQSPWHEQKLLMHVAIKGYEIVEAEKPRTNLVFLVDTSGSMHDDDKLPLVKASLRLLLDRLSPEDTVGLVTYAGEAGVVLEPTPASERRKILDAIDRLGAGGSTAGAAGLEEAYALAEKAFVEGGVNRIMLATDGDFNVGPSDDQSLEHLVETRRKSGVFLSVLGFGQGNYNDQLMQVLAQNGNGIAAYIDTLAEAEKTLVQEASASLFPIAKDVKIQVEFNPDRISEYRLVGYETRALNREDFNNDRVDAGDVGSGHSVTAIYEMTPRESPAQSVDALRYQTNDATPLPDVNTGEFAFLKIRYKAPDSDTSQLLTHPVTESDRLASMEAASEDVRFSIAVAGFGQKLRDADALADHDWERITQLAQGARGADPFGYRSEFLTLVRLASGLSR